AEAPDCRRANDRARRDDPGAGARPDAVADRGDRRGDDPDHARSRRRRRDMPARVRDVHRQARRARAGRRAVRGAPPSLYRARPRLRIADEPPTALDVTIQPQVLDLMRSLTEETGAAMILITHDLGVVAETCRRACVMYTGKLVEDAPVDALFAAPRHPYTA